MVDYSKGTQSTNSGVSDQNSARYRHIDGSVTTPITVRNSGCRLLRVILNTNGATVTIRDGSSDVVAVIALDAPENTYNYGLYIKNSLQVIAGGAVDATIVYGV